MKKLNRFLRIVLIAFMLALAMAGIGLAGAFIVNRDELRNRNPQIENVQRKEKDEPVNFSQ